MKKSEYLEPDTLLQQGISALLKNLGPVETQRFLTFMQKKRMDSVKRHHSWQKKLDKVLFFDEVFKAE